MAIKIISRLQIRRGLRADLPNNLSEGEFGFTLDTRELFIGNSLGYGDNSAILTQYSDNTDIIQNIFTAGNVQFTSTTARSLGDKINDIASIKDFSVLGDGFTDDSTNINLAISEVFGTSYAIGSRNFSFNFPSGVYTINSPILLYPNLSIIGEGIDKTIIRATNSLMTYLFATADSNGQQNSNIGLSSAILPQMIVIRNLTIDTNGYKIDAAHLDRYQNIIFENVKFIGGYVTSDVTSNPSIAVRLQSIGNAILTYSAHFIECEFINFTYGIMSNDPVKYTVISRCKFYNLYRGLDIGESPNYNGVIQFTLLNSTLLNIDNHAIYIGSSNPGITSIGNKFSNCGVTDSVSPVYWDTSSTLNSSIGDTFDSINAVTNLGNNNIILNAQQSSLPVTLPSHTVVQLGNISPTTGTMSYCSNESGGAVPAFYDGTNWRRVTDRNIVS